MTATAPLPDAVATNWVDRHAPVGLRPWLKLGRFDRPTGIWLLLLPGWQGIALAAAMERRLPDLRLIVLFAVGSALMRAAGCAFNDIVDRDIDAKVARTAARPLASGQISVKGALAFVAACCLISLAILLTFNWATIALGVASLALVAIYPFMKRITWWPQAWLGLTFNWGALMGFAAASGGLNAAALLLYAGGVFWTLGYDTIGGQILGAAPGRGGATRGADLLFPRLGAGGDRLHGRRPWAALPASGRGLWRPSDPSGAGFADR